MTAALALTEAVLQAIKDDPEVAPILMTAVDLENHGARQWSWVDVGAHPAQLARLAQTGILSVESVAVNLTHYRLVDRQIVHGTLRRDDLLEQQSHEQVLFDNIVGYDNLKQFLRMSISSIKPIHVLMIGPPASVTGDTKVTIRSEKGIEFPTIAEVQKRFGTERLETLSVSPMDLSASWENLDDVIVHGNSEHVLKISTIGGRVVNATKSHSFLRYDYESECLVPILGSSLKVGDLIPVLKNVPTGTRRTVSFEGTVLPLSKELGFAIGLWLAEGSLNERHGLISTCNNDLAMLQRAQSALKVFPKAGTTYKCGTIYCPTDRASKRLIIQNPVMYRFFEQFLNGRGASPKKGKFAAFKTIASWALDAPDEFVSGLLCGYFSGDGCITKQGALSVVTVSSALAQDVQFLLARFGIIPTIRTVPPGKGGNYPVHYVNIPFRFRVAFNKNIGFAIDAKQKRLDAVDVSTRHDETFCIPTPPLWSAAFAAIEKAAKKHRMTFRGAEIVRQMKNELSKVDKLIDADVMWLKITKIETLEHFEPVYDLSVSGNETFVLANGVVVHNSAKSLFLSDLKSLPNSRMLLGGSTKKAGLTRWLMENGRGLNYLCLDEIDKAERGELSTLLSLMEDGLVSEMKTGRTGEVRLKNVRVYAAGNHADDIPPELLSRFARFNLREYTPKEFIEVCRRTLMLRENVDPDLAEFIAEQTYANGFRSVRDAVRIAHGAKNPEEVGWLIQTLRSYSGD